MENVSVWLLEKAVKQHLCQITCLNLHTENYTYWNFYLPIFVHYCSGWYKWILSLLQWTFTWEEKLCLGVHAHWVNCKIIRLIIVHFGSRIQIFFLISSCCSLIDKKSVTCLCRHTSSLCPLWFNGFSAEKVPFHLTLLLPGFLTLIPVSLHFLIDSLTLFLYDLHRFDRYFSSDEVLQLLDRFYNLEMLVYN